MRAASLFYLEGSIDPFLILCVKSLPPQQERQFFSSYHQIFLDITPGGRHMIS